ncbi:hypothetical protein AOQ84DRAFT_369343 [Glonium stellatum]|uniref:Uncharacterized protein n=1 Tax=Glonium stellatum TaxID=574774 RepID=A0A8E2EPN7_9PEZI|nr:hypothetical protein AOQ84DRAFT_369343 [Glonium stellatum]
MVLRRALPYVDVSELLLLFAVMVPDGYIYLQGQRKYKLWVDKSQADEVVDSLALARKKIPEATERNKRLIFESGEKGMFFQQILEWNKIYNELFVPDWVKPSERWNQETRNMTRLDDILHVPEIWVRSLDGQPLLVRAGTAVQYWEEISRQNSDLEDNRFR